MRVRFCWRYSDLVGVGVESRAHRAAGPARNAKLLLPGQPWVPDVKTLESLSYDASGRCDAVVHADTAGECNALKAILALNSRRTMGE